MNGITTQTGKIESEERESEESENEETESEETENEETQRARFIKHIYKEAAQIPIEIDSEGDATRIQNSSKNKSGYNTLNMYGTFLERYDLYQ